MVDEIVRFHEGKLPYRDTVFRYPIRPGANLQPKGSKAAYINPNLVPVAIEMIEKLLSIRIIERRYTLFAAPTHFIQKTRPKLNLLLKVINLVITWPGWKINNYVRLFAWYMTILKQTMWCFVIPFINSPRCNRLKPSVKTQNILAKLM